MKKIYILILVNVLILCFSVLCFCSCKKNGIFTYNNSSDIFNNKRDDSSECKSAKLIISEIMPSNTSYIQDINGLFSDWIEISNQGNISVVLSDYYISDSKDELKKFRLPKVTLEAGQYYLVFAAGKDSADDSKAYAPFKLSADGESVYLCDDKARVIDYVEYDAVEKNKSVIHDGTVAMYPTPRYSNDDNGYIEYQNSIKQGNKIIVNEVMTMNNSYLPVSSKYYDWVELKNNSSSSINLSNYFISNDNKNLQKCKLPDRILEPNELFCIICDGPYPQNIDGQFFTGFSLNGVSANLYITDSDDVVCDYMHLSYAPYGVSYGREKSTGGTYYFKEPTPGKQNAEGISMVTDVPKVSVTQGVIKDSKAFDVELISSGEIYYTTDGSTPNLNSKKYEKAIHVDKTTVLRAIAVKNGKLKSQTVNASYIFDSQTTLPVLSLMVAKDDLLGEESGIYVVGKDPQNPNYYKDLEKSASLTLFENNEIIFSSNCGLKMFGSGSRADCYKKSLRVNFKSKYGADEINSDIFSNGVTKYESLVMRGGEDTPRTLFRNELFTTLGAECMPNLLVQSNKFCTLYVNGEYWGVFCLCEHFSDCYYAEHMNVSKGSVTINEAPFSSSSPMGSFLNFTLNNDMSESQNYKYICDNININSLIDYFILQAYSRNRDIGGNIRYFYSSEIGKWQYAYYDFDWAFFKSGGWFDILTNGEQYSVIINRLFLNSEFKSAFCNRLAYLLDTTLSDDNVLSVINRFHDTLQPEIERERQRWPQNAENWEKCVQRLRNYVTSQNLQKELILSLKQNVGLSDSEINTYFSKFMV